MPGSYGVFGPGLYYYFGMAFRDDVAGAFAIFVSGESVDVIAVTMRRYYGVELALTPPGDVLGNLHEESGFACDAAEIDQDVTISHRVMEGQQETIAEADVVDAQGQF